MMPVDGAVDKAEEMTDCCLMDDGAEVKDEPLELGLCCDCTALGWLTHW